MDAQLRPGLFAAACGRDLVFLDVDLGRYDLAPGGAIGVSLGDTGQGLAFADPAMREMFESAGLLSDSVVEASPGLPPLPTRSALRPDAGINLADVGRHGLAWLEMLRVFRAAPLPRLIQRVHDAERTGGAAPRDCEVSLCEAHAAAFERLLAWTPGHGHCVYRSYMLRRLLQRDGLFGVRWVFGVRTWPFYAHCWLQIGEVSLTDHAEPLNAFSPIFSV